MDGWIKLYRSLLSSPEWRSCKESMHQAILVTLLLMASHSECKMWFNGEEIMLKPGQVITSLQGICDLAGGTVAKKNVRSALSKFEKMGFLAQKATKTGRLITILNWGKYQSYDDATGIDSGKEVAKDWQRGGNATGTKQEDKECKNGKKYSGVFTPPSREEVAAYCRERGNKVDLERFIDYYTSNGWMVGKNKMKDWKATVRRWEKDEDKPAEKTTSTVGQSGWNYTGQRQYDDEFFKKLEGGKK